jgi:hypothetical protein
LTRLFRCLCFAAAAAQVFYTTTPVDNPIYALVLGWPASGVLNLTQPIPGTANATVEMIVKGKGDGDDAVAYLPLEWRYSGSLLVTMPRLAPPQLSSLHGPWVLRLNNFV